MAKRKAALFIDGSNFYHALKDNQLFGFFSYKSFVNEISKEFDIEQTFFYDAVKNRLVEPDQYPRQQAFHEKLKAEIPGIIIKTRKLKYLPSNERIVKAKQNSKFCSKCRPCIDDFLSKAGLLKLSKEKGVDILLVTDMIKGAFENKFETALIASGDADFVPAVELLRELKKQAINLHFYKGSSTELRNACNSHRLILVSEKRECFFK
jgi:uncharacterized LabA/DUF88 family protein